MQLSSASVMIASCLSVGQTGDSQHLKVNVVSHCLADVAPLGASPWLPLIDPFPALPPSTSC